MPVNHGQVIRAQLKSISNSRRSGTSPWRFGQSLRLYEERGYVVPGRTAAGWRSYGPDEMVRATEIVALRALGLSLTQVGAVLAGDGVSLEQALANHQVALERRIGDLAGTIQKVGALRADIARGKLPDAGHLTGLLRPLEISIAFDLPWPWGGERFELRDLRAMTYIIGPMGSGKTRLAKRLAEALPGATFLPLERGPASALSMRAEAALGWLAEEGADVSDALVILLAAIESDDTGPLVIDMIEEGLDQPTQEALAAYLRRRSIGGRPLLAMTRSSSILDLGAVGGDATILFCPANHSPPMLVEPFPGAAGYEAVASCLASPEVRARTAGAIVFRPEADQDSSSVRSA